MKRVVLYLRVSTSAQEEGYSIDMQKESLLAYCKAHGWIVVAIIVDPGFSGSTLERPGIQEVINMAVNKSTDMVLVYKLDRLSRSQKDTMHLIEDIFLPNGVDFSSMQEKLDTSSAFGMAMVGILSVFAQLERENIKERTFGGRVERAKDGLWHGGGFDPIGYDYIEGELVVNPVESAQVRRVFNLYAAGFSVTEISQKMMDAGFQTKHGDWSHTNTVCSVLDNELYAGIVHFDGERSEGEAHVPIIPRPLFEKVRKLREINKNTHFRQKDSKHILTGFVFCGSCGARYFAKVNRSGNFYYCCHSRAKVNKSMVVDPDCRNRNWKKNELESLVESEILRIAEDPEYLLETIKKRAAGECDPSFVSIQREIEDINKRLQLLMDEYQKSKMSIGEVSAQINDLYTQKVALSQRVDVMDAVEKGEGIIPEHIKSLLRDVRFSWVNWDVKYRRHVLRQLLVKIEVMEGSAVFDWTF